MLNNRYYLSEIVACKNFCQVYLARDIIKHRKCVIKRLDGSSDRSKSWQKTELMFQQEAAILEKLAGKHDRISQFYDYFQEDTCWYLVQEWIPGITLEEKLRLQGKLSESQTRKIVLDLLTVLECIHSMGIVHGDIKPHNIMLRSPDNLSVLIDFGTARPMGDRHQPQSIVGTPGYMSVEQAMGRIAYHNDLYSLGLTAIHLLTGKSPLDIDWQDRIIPISDSFKKIIDRAIAPHPKQRFASAEEMRFALLGTTAPSSASSGYVSRPRSKSRVLFSILGVQIAAAVFGWFYLATNLDEQPPVKLGEIVPQTPIDEDRPTAIAPIVPAESIWKEIIFSVGTSKDKIFEALGEPVWRKPGFWTNSTAWLYENIVADGIDIGYIFDRETNKLRQAEITVPPDTALSTIQSALDMMLAEKANSNVAEGLRSVYQRRQAIFNFTAGNLEGTIQCNHKNRIYIAIWLSGFH